MSSPAEPKKNRLRRFLLEALLVLFVFWGISTWQTRNLLGGDGKAAPPFTLADLQGNEVRLVALEGKTVLLHFWATWCGVCRQEFSALNSIYDALDTDEVLLTVVADAEDPGRIERFVKEHGIRYPVLLGTNDVLERFRVSAFPTNYYLDESGRIVGSAVGLSNRWAMRARLGCAKSD